MFQFNFKNKLDGVTKTMVLIMFLTYCFAYSYYYILSYDGKLALAIKDDKVGFEKFNPRSNYQKINIRDNSLSIDGRSICASNKSSELRVCKTNAPINNKFSVIIINNKRHLIKIVNRMAFVLSKSNFNQNTEVCDAILIEEPMANVENYVFRIIPCDDRSF